MKGFSNLSLVTRKKLIR